ncbi:rod shape-determining protein MreC [uncultured Dokdonia sp.]|uniref:rod shape-determining protein MreC n=1 Tax=uncultured Dokdonia sp. TaxID=575653 RepID=UPI0026230C5F|nr:rod shape-determining protein MreC [uncultured Dokdonia sp.]
MQQIINFLIRNKNFLLFAFLFCLSLVFTIQSHSYHKSKFINSANFLSGGIYESASSIQDYFHLKTYNKQLLEENARLREKEARLYTITGSSDSLSIYDAIESQFRYIPAKVLKNSYSKTDNIITLKAGRRDSILPEMGVITSQGIVGFIEKTSTKYSTVLSILNTNFKTNAKLRASEHYGTLEWNGQDPNIMTVIDMQEQAPVKIGDTIETSGQSAIFPKGIPIGTIEEFELDNSKNFYTLSVRLFNDMTSLGHVYIIENTDKNEITTLQENSIDEE